VPFTGRRGTKPRPAVVVSAESFHRTLLDVIVCPISSQSRYYQRPGAGDHLPRHWKAVGLRHPSTARMSNLVAIEKTLIKRSLGPLHPEDLAAIDDGLRTALGLSSTPSAPPVESGTSGRAAARRRVATGRDR
jgi:mRNA-degrading endonuclease toxin of MazEF toxin-antitoxin module